MKKLFTTLMLTVTLQSFAQWNTDINENLEVSSYKANVEYSARTSDGKTYVFFFEENTTDNYVPRVQLLDAEGNKLFGNDGIIVKSAGTFASFIQVSDIAVDAENNLIVSFFATNDAVLYANKISPSGENLWGNSGVSVASGGAFPKIVALNSGVVIGYTLSGKGYLQKFDSSTGAALWSTPIISPAVSGLNNTSVTELSRLSDDSFVSISSSKGTAFSAIGTLVAQRYDGTGTPLWANPTQLTSTTGVQYNVRYDHIVDNDNVYIGYYTSGISGSKFDAFVQRISPDGTLPWGDNGKDVSTSDYYEMKTNIGINGDDLWAISTFTDDTQGPRGEYIQKFNKISGDVEFDPAAKEIYPLAIGSAAFTHFSSIQFLNNVPVFVTADNTDISVDPVTLRLVTLDSNDGTKGDEYLISASSVKSNIAVNSYNNQLVAVWSDVRNSSNPEIYAQNFKLPDMDIQNIKQSYYYQIYPNPSSATVQIKTSKEIKENMLYDLSGKEIMKITGDSVDITSVKQGIYILKSVFADGTIATEKLIKK